MMTTKIICDYCDEEAKLYYTMTYSADLSEHHICAECNLKLIDTIKWLEKNNYKQKFWKDGWKKK